MSTFLHHVHVRAGWHRTLKGKPLSRSPGKWTCIDQNITRRKMELDQRIHQVSKRSCALIRTATMRIASLSIQQGNTNLSSFYDTIINQSQRAGKQLWRSSGEENFV